LRVRPVNEEEYNRKYATLRILKSIQEYLKADSPTATAVYPIKVPDDLLIQVLKLEGPEEADNLIHHIFKLGLNFWSEKIFSDVFGSPEQLEEFVELVKARNREGNRY
jgi:hypothetical protein